MWCGAEDDKVSLIFIDLQGIAAECGFRTTPEECLYDSGPIGPSV